MIISRLIWTTVLVTCLLMIIRMGRKTNLIQIMIVNNNNHPAMTAMVHLGQGNPYALDQLWQIKKRVEHDKILQIILQQPVNTIRETKDTEKKEIGKERRSGNCIRQY